MKNILTRINDQYSQLTKDGKEPDCLFVSAEGKKRLTEQASIAYDIQASSLDHEFLGMKIFVASQYRGDDFRIYCKVKEWKNLE